jgi:branched-chain amino acid transport system substrate-binding protein
MRRGRRIRLTAMALLVIGLISACAAPSQPSSTSASNPSGDIQVGAVFPLEGNAAGLASEELSGVQAAVDFVNADGGILGRRLVLNVRDLESGADAPRVMADLKASGTSAVIGAYASALSIPASQAASDAGLVYWEAGAVADQLTGRGLPLVFRVGASGTNLGSNSAQFAATQLAPMLDRTPDTLQLAIVAADDEYATSVADAAVATAQASGTPIVLRASYDLAMPDWPAVMARLRAAHPDVIVLASHIPDGIAFRRAMLTADVRVGALIGSTMAECDPDFAGDLGPDAVGVFASDRPTGGFQPSALTPDARALYDRFASTWAARTADQPQTDEYARPVPSADDGDYTIRGPTDAGTQQAGPSEEGLSGFAAGWVLLHDVLPAAARSGSLEAGAIAAAARQLDLPTGSLPNGAGVRFSPDPATLGQNERAAAVIWQWQAVRSYTFVWPPTYRTGEISFVPLAR